MRRCVGLADVGQGAGALEQPGSKAQGKEPAEHKCEVEYVRAGRKAAAIGAKARAEYTLEPGAVASAYVSPLVCLPQYKAITQNALSPAKNGTSPNGLAGDRGAAGRAALPTSWNANVPLCPFQFRGHCNNPKCPMQHLGPR